MRINWETILIGAGIGLLVWFFIQRPVKKALDQPKGDGHYYPEEGE